MGWKQRFLKMFLAHHDHEDGPMMMIIIIINRCDGLEAEILRLRKENDRMALVLDQQEEVTIMAMKTIRTASASASASSKSAQTRVG